MINSIDFNKIFNTSRFLIESNSVICFILDLTGNVLFFNEAYKKILGYKATNIEDKLINPDLKAIIKKKNENPIFEGILTLSKEKANTSYEAKVFKNEGRLIFVCEYNTSDIESLYKQMSANSLEINNINRKLIKTQYTLKKTIQELKETQSMLIQSEKMNALGKLVAGVAHEINNPMAYVTGNIEVIQEYYETIKSFISEMESTDLKEYESLINKYDLEYILSDFSSLNQSTLNGARRVNKIVSDLRDYSRIDSSEQVLCNIKDCINDALSIANPEIKNKKIELVLNLKETHDIECYPAELNQAFLNIIINSIQAVQERGKINISLYEKEDDIYIEIEDDGYGIEEENLNKIYDAFFTTKPPGEGVGLGLNIVYRTIVNTHSGNIEVESRIGKGTKFIIRLG